MVGNYTGFKNKHGEKAYLVSMGLIRTIYNVYGLSAKTSVIYWPEFDRMVSILNREYLCQQQ